MPAPYVTLREALSVRSTKIPNGCILWNGTVNEKGYGSLTFHGLRYWAHRAAYEVYLGKIPAGLLVLHKCDTPDCINPEHLFLGTHADNGRDKAQKGRAADKRGELNGRSVLTKEDVLTIRDLFHNHEYTRKNLSKKFKISYSAVKKIINGTTWGDC